MNIKLETKNATINNLEGLDYLLSRQLKSTRVPIKISYPCTITSLGDSELQCHTDATPNSTTQIRILRINRYTSFIMTDKKLAIFDLDGVLIDSKTLHFVALNEALSHFSPDHLISTSDHVTKFDGLSTKKKLQILHKERGLDPSKFEKIIKLKQATTLKLLGEIDFDPELDSYLKFLEEKGVALALASNSINKTVEVVLKKLGVYNYFSLILSNEDILFPKPHPEIFWKTMAHFGALPENTFIFEDSFVGRLAAQRSGAQLIPVDSRKDLSWEKINKIIDESFGLNSPRIPWKSDSLNVLIPMAGAGSRFETAGYTFPKPLIEVHGRPMIQAVVENLNIDAKFIYLVQKNHFEKYNLDYLLRLITPKCEIIQVDGITEGAACTTLLAKKFIDNEDSLLIANSDQFIEWNSGETIYAFMSEGIDGGVVTFNSTHPKWSFVKLSEEGTITEVAEKKPISNIATAGIYFWKKGSDYVRFLEQMIEKNIRTNNEFYVCPVYNEAIQANKKFRIRNIDKMWGLGTPEDLKYFIENYK